MSMLIDKLTVIWIHFSCIAAHSNVSRWRSSIWLLCFVLARSFDVSYCSLLRLPFIQFVLWDEISSASCCHNEYSVQCWVTKRKMQDKRKWERERERFGSERKYSHWEKCVSNRIWASKRIKCTIELSLHFTPYVDHPLFIINVTNCQIHNKGTS